MALRLAQRLALRRSLQLHGPARLSSSSLASTARCLSTSRTWQKQQKRDLATATDLHKAPSPNDAFATGGNRYYAEEMYKLWKADPDSVHPSWNVYFSGLAKGLRSEDAFRPPPSSFDMSEMGGASGLGMSTDTTGVQDHQKIQLLVRAYQVRGHHKAQLDPLGLLNADLDNKVPVELTLDHYGWTNKDLDTEFSTGPGILPHFAEAGISKLTLREIIKTLERVYCSSIGVQYLHIPNREECDWLRQRLEVPEPWKYSVDEKRMILDRMIWSDSFERFIASKFPNEKRFGLEGGESLIPGMKALIDRSVDAGVKSVVIGMPHRGRLNVLANVIRKPIEAILNEFTGTADPENEGSGDVKYHLGANYVRPTPSGKRVALSLVANPSHLEAADPVVLGKTRALQFFDGNDDVKTAMAVLLHGDAAFAGQGVVYETMGFGDLPNYSTGGTVHLIVNNQIGFTTDPRQGRSTPYPSDIAKAIDAPIFHVNGDDPEAVTFVSQLAADWRAKFGKDVVIDVVCYRKHGHNETDQPSFTQPIMYAAIAKQTSTLELYAQRLIDEGTFKQDEVDKHKKWVWGMLEKAFEGSKEYQATSREWLSSSWDGFPSPKELKANILEARPTGVEIAKLQEVGKAIASYPKDFEPHRNLQRILAQRGKACEDGEGLDWATGEALAFGTLALEGNHIRLSGQDVERGTFSQRHAVLHHQKTAERYMALGHLSKDQAHVTICNSSLSEYGVLGFELGYSLVDPNLLDIWEAQFGDFANTAQVMIDQFICSGERKWLQRTGLTLSLPHGYDGQGPEHSSARIERFLQLCDDHPYHFPNEEKVARQHQDCNMQVVYMTTPANYFHVLRRQIHRDFRKPLIIFFSKSLLRHPQAKSSLKEMEPGTHFLRYIPEPMADQLVTSEEIKRHILCCGQTYYQLTAEREARGLKNVAISRVEQISPFPYDLVVPSLDSYPNADIKWVQEEPLNAGPWGYVSTRIETAMANSETCKDKKLTFAGRAPTSSVATGSKKAHAAEIKRYLNEAFEGLE